MLSLGPIYDRCRNRLQKDNLGARLWAVLCVALFLIAMAVSMLGCSEATLSPGQQSTQVSGGAIDGSALGFPGAVNSMGGRFASGALVGLQIQNQQIRPYFGGY
jgi:hypothetical protein